MILKAHVTKMRDHGNWEDPEALTDFLAGQLLSGSIALVLGAGISGPFGLPTWDALADRLLQSRSLQRRPSEKVEDASERLLTLFNNDRVEFARAVRSELYRDTSLDLRLLQRSELLTAIGAMVMGSSRGSAAQVVTFNFDDVLETYLSYYGYDVQTIDHMPNRNTNADVKVLHPHGLLPHQGEVERGIVFTQADYDNIVGASQTAWHRAQAHIYSTHVCIFIGLSGRDSSLSSLMSTVNKDRDSNGELFWGVRIDASDERREHWERRGVFQWTLPSYEEIPSVLLEICQRAAELRTNGRHATAGRRP